MNNGGGGTGSVEGDPLDTNDLRRRRQRVPTSTIDAGLTGPIHPLDS